MSVSSFTHADETVQFSTSKLHYGKPMEPLCKENFSPLLKHLKSVNPNPGQGLESILNLDEFMRSPYKQYTLGFEKSELNFMMKVQATIVYEVEFPKKPF